MPSPGSALAIFSLLALCVEIVFGVRSYTHCDVLWHPHGPDGRFTMTSEFGKVVFEVEPRQRAPIKPGWVFFDSPLPRAWPRRPDVGGFVIYHTMARHYLLLPATPVWGIVFPHWFVAVICAAPAVAWIIRRRRELALRLRLRLGLCHECGYNLKHNQSGICPECGTRLSSPKAQFAPK